MHFARACWLPVENGLEVVVDILQTSSTGLIMPICFLPWHPNTGGVCLSCGRKLQSIISYSSLCFLLRSAGRVIVSFLLPLVSLSLGNSCTSIHGAESDRQAMAVAGGHGSQLLSSKPFCPLGSTVCRRFYCFLSLRGDDSGQKRKEPRPKSLIVRNLILEGQSPSTTHCGLNSQEQNPSISHLLIEGGSEDRGQLGSGFLNLCLQCFDAVFIDEGGMKKSGAQIFQDFRDAMFIPLFLPLGCGISWN